MSDQELPGQLDSDGEPVEDAVGENASPEGSPSERRDATGQRP